MKRITLSCLLALLLGSVLLAQTPHRWSVEAIIGKGFENSPKMAYGFQAGFSFFSSEMFRMGIGTGVSLSKPMNELLASGERISGYSEWAIPAYLRGEFMVPSQTNGNIVLRTDVGYRVGVKTVFYKNGKNIYESDTHYWSGFFAEPQIGLLVSDRLFFSIGYCLQRGHYIQTSKTTTEDVHRFLPVLSFHLEARF